MKLHPRRIFTISDDVHENAGVRVDRPLRKIAVGMVLENPFARRLGEDLSGMIQASPELGSVIGHRLTGVLNGDQVQSYGKGGIVGVDGEQEHANALLTTAFANPIRDMIGNAPAWISSFTKVAAAGTALDIPMNHIGDVYVRSHYDGMTVTIPGSPLPDEIVIVFCVATRGRINARVGGMTHEEVEAKVKTADKALVAG